MKWDSPTRRRDSTATSPALLLCGLVLHAGDSLHPRNVHAVKTTEATRKSISDFFRGLPRLSVRGNSAGSSPDLVACSCERSKEVLGFIRN
jgi:hypothetical protein